MRTTALFTLLSLPVAALAQPGPAPAPAPAPAPGAPIVGPAPDVPERTGRTLDLAEALARAGRRNLTVRAAREEIARARGTLRKAWSAFLPRVSAQLTYTILDEERETDLEEFFPGSGTIQVQPRTTFGATGSAVLPLVHPEAFPTLAAARAGRASAALATADARRQIQIAVARSYYAILSAHRFRDLQVRARANALEHLGDAQARHEVGVGVRLDVTRAALEVEQTTAAIIAAQALEDDAYDALAVLLDLGDPYRVVEPAATRAPAQRVDGLVQAALARRPDVRAARIGTENAQRGVTAAWAAFAPSLDLAFNLSYSDFVGTFTGGDHVTWNVVFLLDIPLYDGGLRYGTLDERRAALRIAELRERELARSASLEVRKAHRAWRTSIARLETSRRQVALGEDALRLALAAYESGAATNIEVVDAQRQHRDAEANLLVATYDSQVALANLLLSAGLPLR